MVPSSYKRRILVCVTGLAPQVITETLYALCVLEKPKYIPTEIHIITTKEGAERAKLTLFSQKYNNYRTFLSDYNIDSNVIQFDPSNIHVITDSEGIELEDIRTESESLAAGDTILSFIREFTNDSNSSIHASIAGGRKTLGYFVGYALSLFGREQDKLSHVLVSPQFESLPNFFFPPATPQTIQTRDGKLISTLEVKISLSYVPFARVGGNRGGKVPARKVFISYSRKDSDSAKKIYDKLQEKGFSPWLDTESLLPGQRWENEIGKSINESDFVILLISSNSIDRRGYFQKEIKTALKAFELVSEQDIYLIPVRLDATDIPLSLSAIQFVDLFPEFENGFNKLVRTFNHQFKETSYKV